MNIFVTNDGFTQVWGADCQSFATVEWTHPVTGHQCKSVCFDHEELMQVLKGRQTPGHFHNDYIPNIRYSEEAMQLYGIGGDEHAGNQGEKVS